MPTLPSGFAVPVIATLGFKGSPESIDIAAIVNAEPALGPPTSTDDEVM